MFFLSVLIRLMRFFSMHKAYKNVVIRSVSCLSGPLCDMFTLGYQIGRPLTQSKLQAQFKISWPAVMWEDASTQTKWVGWRILKVSTGWCSSLSCKFPTSATGANIAFLCSHRIRALWDGGYFFCVCVCVNKPVFLCFLISCVFVSFCFYLSKEHFLKDLFVPTKDTSEDYCALWFSKCHWSGYVLFW